MAKDDGVDVLADLLVIVSFLCFFLKLRASGLAATETEKRKSQPGVSLHCPVACSLHAEIAGRI